MMYVKPEAEKHSFLLALESCITDTTSPSVTPTPITPGWGSDDPDDEI